MDNLGGGGGGWNLCNLEVASGIQKRAKVEKSNKKRSFRTKSNLLNTLVKQSSIQKSKKVKQKGVKSWHNGGLYDTKVGLK